MPKGTGPFNRENNRFWEGDMRWGAGGCEGFIIMCLFIAFPAHEVGKRLLAFGRYLLFFLS